jgi:hypothetical protein
MLQLEGHFAESSSFKPHASGAGSPETFTSRANSSSFIKRATRSPFGGHTEKEFLGNGAGDMTPWVTGTFFAGSGLAQEWFYWRTLGILGGGP